jgi:D-3-phosphoglycerate dehydrogenase
LRLCGIKKTLIAAPEGNRNAVAEHTLGMILSLFNNLNKADREFDQDIGTEKAIGDMSWMSKTVGIIGYGNMKCFAKKLRGFEVEVL